MRRIRTRLLGAILLAALLPVIPATLLVRDLLQRSQQAWLAPALVGGLEAGMDESRRALQDAKLAFAAAAARVEAGPGDDVIVLDALGRRAPSETLPAEVMAAAPGVDERPREVGGWLVIKRQVAPGAATRPWRSGCRTALPSARNGSLTP